MLADLCGATDHLTPRGADGACGRPLDRPAPGMPGYLRCSLGHVAPDLIVWAG